MQVLRLIDQGKEISGNEITPPIDASIKGLKDDYKRKMQIYKSNHKDILEKSDKKRHLSGQKMTPLWIRRIFVLIIGLLMWI
jgi:hypothetical protein